MATTYDFHLDAFFEYAEATNFYLREASPRVGKASIRKVKEAFDKTDDPVAMLAILRKSIARQYSSRPGPQARQVACSPKVDSCAMRV